ncbi:MAB_1171c family putative transporter [Kitasatospora sp. NPDC091335]|uniref:MAB_1171c family putative transporter n=1 Tax=Kitasatospora sp. NPDC091335 TaxID=3364085 RepID=UPI00382B849C
MCTIACWWYSRGKLDLALRVGVRLFGLGAFFAGLYWMLNTVYILARYSWIPSVSPILMACYAFARASAICVPLGTAATLALRRIRALRQLRPLWRALVNSVPDVRLMQNHRSGLGLLQFPDPLDLHLYRTVIEIRDAILELRAYIPQTVLDDVRDHLEREGTPPDEIGPRMTACWLRIACHAKAGGTPPIHGELTVPALGGEDLPGDIEFLRKVAKAGTSAQILELAAHFNQSIAAR